MGISSSKGDKNWFLYALMVYREVKNLGSEDQVSLIKTKLKILDGNNPSHKPNINFR